MKVDTVLKDCFDVYLINRHECIARVLWGFVDRDFSGRWLPNRFVTTSPVIDQWDNGFYITRNSVYQVIGVPESVELALGKIELIRNQANPIEYRTLLHLYKMDSGINGKKH